MDKNSYRNLPAPLKTFTALLLALFLLLAAVAVLRHTVTVHVSAKPSATASPTTTHTTPPVEHATTQTPSVTAQAPVRDTYVVQPGDSLYSISVDKLHTQDWHALYALNQGSVPDPGLILPGQTLYLN